MTNEIYVSVDVETDGPIPGPHSMLSFGAAAFSSKVGLLGTFSRNLETLPGAVGDEGTMKWWGRPENKAAWDACRADLVSPEEAMKAFVQWVTDLPGIEKAANGRPTNAVFVAYPAGFDFLFGYWYLIRFAGWSPFSFSALDVKTYAMATMGSSYRKSTKKNMPREWFSKRPHTHVAVDDALEQGELFMNMMAANHRRFQNESGSR